MPARPAERHDRCLVRITLVRNRSAVRARGTADARRAHADGAAPVSTPALSGFDVESNDELHDQLHGPHSGRTGRGTPRCRSAGHRRGTPWRNRADGARCASARARRTGRLRAFAPMTKSLTSMAETAHPFRRWSSSSLACPRSTPSVAPASRKAVMPREFMVSTPRAEQAAQNAKSAPAARAKACWTSAPAASTSTPVGASTPIPLAAIAAVFATCCGGSHRSAAPSSRPTRRRAP